MSAFDPLRTFEIERMIVPMARRREAKAMGRYLRNGFIQAALIIVVGFLLPDLIFRMPPTIGQLVTGGMLLILALALALWGIRAVRKTPLNDERQQLN